MKKNNLFVLFLFYSLLTSAQTPEKKVEFITFDGPASTLNICTACSLDSMVTYIKKRISTYPNEKDIEFNLQRSDTVLEKVEFSDNGYTDYSNYINDRLKVSYSEITNNTNDFTLIVMNEMEMELKQWIIHPNEKYITDYDGNGKIKKYIAEIISDMDTKIVYQKVWNGENYVSGQSNIYKKNKERNWLLISTNSLSEYAWP